MKAKEGQRQVWADLRCRQCSGSGFVTDHVPYGMGGASMQSVCDCVLEQMTDDEIEGEFAVMPAKGYGGEEELEPDADEEYWRRGDWEYDNDRDDFGD